MANGDKTLNTGGGASVGNNVQTDGGDFVGRDQINFIVPLGNWEKVQRLLFKGQARTNATQALQAQFQSFDWAKAEAAYLDKVIKLYDRVRILGSSADVPLGNLFTQVYILDKPTARYRYDIEELRKRSHNRIEFQQQPGERINGLALVKQGQNLFILGKPGAGKTTFLRYITIQAALKQLSRIPIFVSLNQWADSRWGKGDKAALLPFLVEQFAICDFPDADLFIDYLLRAGQALVLFDGLDEVKQEKDQRRRLTRLLQDFARQYDKSQHLITCRIAASDYAFAGFADVEVADFTPEQIQEYSRNWFGAQTSKADAFIVELAKADNKGLTELCNTPLLLSLLCLTFDNNMRFPPNRAELYEDALETLLRKWDSSREIQRDEIYRELSHKRKLQLLMSIAVPAFQRGELFFRQRDLEKWLVDYLVKLPGAPPADTLDGTVLLKAMEVQHGILVERAQGIYSFSHLTFQEYLTARYLAENQGKSETDNLIRTHLTDQRWREVFLLTANLLDDINKFIDVLQQAVDLIIINTPRLHRLLSWAQERTFVANAPIERRTYVQSAYIGLALARSIARTLASASNRAHDLARERALERELDRTRTRALALAHTHERDLEHALAHANDRARDLALDCTIVLALDRELTISHVRTSSIALARARSLSRSRERDRVLSIVRALALATTPLVGFDYGLYYVWAYATLFTADFDRTDKEWQVAMATLPVLIESVTELAKIGGQNALAQQLFAVSIPTPDAIPEAWQQYADSLFTTLHTQRDLGHEWEFTNAEMGKLDNYFYANELLVECIKVGVVSDRYALLNRILLPPSVA